MIPIIYIFLIMAGLFSFLYAVSPKADTPAGAIYRVLFMFLALISILVGVWTTGNVNVTEYKVITDVYGSVVNYENLTIVSPPNLTNVTDIYMAVLVAIILLVLGIMLIFNLYNVIAKTLNSRKEKDEGMFE